MKKQCCEGEAAVLSPFDDPDKPVKIENTRYIHFSSLTAGERQAFCDFQFKELHRHQQDIDAIRADLEVMRTRYELEPRRVYIGAWLEVEK
jgi:hypothetical protein